VKKLIVLSALVVFVVGLVVVSQESAFSAWGKSKDITEAKAEGVKSEETAEEKLVCKFKNAEEMAEFEQLYVLKQATFGRMGVLQAYFAMEQNNLNEIDKQIEGEFGFKLDPTKMYDLNRDTMEIKEKGPIAAPAQQ